jgi:hypothetical protein
MGRQVMWNHRLFRHAVLLAVWPLVAPAALRAQSAIGQLESLTGQRIQRPSINGSAPAGFGDASSALGAFSLGLEMLNMFDAMSSSPGPDPVQAAIEQHMQMLEQQRIQSQRMMTASRLRDFWDRQDMDSSQTLGDVLSAPVQGTAFFGQPANPSSAVDPFALPPASVPVAPPGVPPAVPSPVPAPVPTPQPVSPGASSGAPTSQAPWTGMTVPSPSADHAARFQDEILTGKEWTREYAKDVGKEILKRCVDALPGHWNADLMLEHEEKMTDFIDQVVTALEPKRLVNALVHGKPEDVDAVMDGLDTVERRATGLGLADHGLEAEEVDTLARWAQGQTPKMKELMGHFTKRAKSFVVEKQVDHLLGDFD